MKNRVIKILLCIVIVFVLVGCEKSKYKTDGFKSITCTRNAETSDDSIVDINYEVYYNNKGYIEVLHSMEKVTSSSADILDQYEAAYKSSFSVYDELDYYKNTVTRKDQTVTSETYINYGKIDMDKLMEIEGTEDNVKVTNGKVKLSDWKSFARKYGISCEDNE